MSDVSHAEGPVHSILSPEAVQLEMPVSGPAPRMLAYAIDQVATILLIFFLLILVLMSETFGASLRQIFAAFARGAVRGAHNLARLSKGQMIGVRYNKDKEWVGGTFCWFEQ